MKPANFAPLYAGLYPDFAEIARKHGYAMALHGSLARDMDVICIPWTEGAADPQTVVDELVATFDVKSIDGNPTCHAHGRLVFTLIISFNECFMDLSFMPRAVSTPVADDTAELAATLKEALLLVDEYGCKTPVGHIATECEVVCARIRAAIKTGDAP